MKSEHSIPLYQQVKEKILLSIQKGEYSSGDKLPTENELENIYGVSRITVRKALEELTHEGYIVRRQGNGTFVSSDKLNRNIATNVSFTSVCEMAHTVPGAKVIKSVIEPATKDDIAELGLSENASVIVIERIRYANSVPVSVETCRFCDDFVFLLDEDLNDNSLYRLLSSKYDIQFADSSKTIEIVFSNFGNSKYLNVSVGYPLLSICSVVSDTKGKKAFRSRQYIVGDRFRLTI